MRVKPLKSYASTTAWAVMAKKPVMAALKISHSSRFSGRWNHVKMSVPNAWCGPDRPVRSTSVSRPCGSQCDAEVIISAIARIDPGTSERRSVDTGVSANVPGRGSANTPSDTSRRIAPRSASGSAPTASARAAWSRGPSARASATPSDATAVMVRVAMKPNRSWKSYVSGGGPPAGGPFGVVGFIAISPGG
jgi:hypothetical protein